MLGLLPGLNFVGILSVRQLLFVLLAHRSNVVVAPVDQPGDLIVRLPTISQVGVAFVSVPQDRDDLFELVLIVLHVLRID